jgi:RND family efflux transporter MFP subunit
MELTGQSAKAEITIMNRFQLPGAPGIVLFLTALLAGGCGPAPAAKGTKTPEVTVTKPTTGDVTDYQDFTGRLEAVKTVDIRARVSGYVKEVPFKEGDLVQKGDLLFQIDPQTYEADLKQAEANLKLAEADRRLFERNLERSRRLFGTRAANQEDYDTNMAGWERAGANIDATTAARNRAKLYLDWTRVTAPMAGRISRRYVDPGNLIKADDTMLTTMVTEDPMYAYFDVDERTYLDLRALTQSAGSSWFSDLHFPVLFRLANEEEFIHPGAINFLDNRVSATTGTIRMRGEFPNPGGQLKAGLFARIRLPIGAPYKAILVPDEALLSDQGKKYVYVVTDKNDKGEPLGHDRVVYRSVKIGQAVDGLRVIKEGLKADERVIIDGMQRVRPETEVKAALKPPPKPPTQALTQLLTAAKPAEGDKTPGRDASAATEKGSATQGAGN